MSDNGKEFEGDFMLGLEYDGSYYDTTAAMAPHQNGMCERRGGVWKETFNKMVVSVAPKDRKETDEILTKSILRLILFLGWMDIPLINTFLGRKVNCRVTLSWETKTWLKFLPCKRVRLGT